MKTKRTPLLNIGLFVGLALSLQNATAGQLVNLSQFVGYTNGPLGQAGNTELWTGTSGNYQVVAGSGSLDGTALGLTSSRGDKAEINATDATGLNTYNAFASSGQFRPDIQRNLYYSFLARFNNASDISTTFERIFQVNRQNSGSAHTLLGLVRSVGSQIQVGVNKTNGTPAFSTKNINPGETVFLVFRHQIIPPGGSGDIVDVWVNPATNSFGVDEAIAPPPEPDATVMDGGEDASNTGPGRFYLVSGINASFDELRIGTNWADVTPFVGDCIPAALLTQPEDVTVVAGIPGKFSVVAEGTTPAFHWQFSSDNGATWFNVGEGTGQNTAIYTTPMTSISMDGRLYRVVVDVDCGAGTSVTSSVVKLTVQSPVITPAGPIMADYWTNDMAADAPPINETNSLWFFSSGSVLYVDNASGNLAAVPASGSSSLWLGYYTDDSVTNLPVHLNVGRGLRATLKFKATGAAATDGALRIGLFDYADGGTRVTNSSFTGSGGNGVNVRGYMANINFSSTFSANQPLTLYARRNLDSGNLMGTTGDYLGLGSGPAGSYLNSPGIQEEVWYNLEFTVARTNLNGVRVGINIEGGGTNWSHTVGESAFNYHRFDALGIRPATRETTANWLEISEFKVAVENVQLPTPDPIPLMVGRSGEQLTLTWSDPLFQLEAAPSLSVTFTNVPGAVSPYAVPTGTGQLFFRLKAAD